MLYGLVREEALALVLQSDEARIVRMGPSAPLLDAADRLRRLPEGRDVRGRLLLEGEPPTTESLLDLVSARRHLTQPLALPESVTRVLISPVGRLGYVPFALLLPDREVVYVPSGTTWRLLRREEQATETKLHEVVRTQERWRAVHFVCHGLVDPEHPMLSALALTADVENDGFLTALEILTMRIPADLVVLSACETGKGRIYRTEGILGLARSFMFAGTPRVLCSLWKVDDAAALERAQAYVRSHEQWEHPYYWAAWVLWGLD